MNHDFLYLPDVEEAFHIYTDYNELVDRIADVEQLDRLLRTDYCQLELFNTLKYHQYYS